MAEPSRKDLGNCVGRRVLASGESCNVYLNPKARILTSTVESADGKVLKFKTFHTPWVVEGPGRAEAEAANSAAVQGAWLWRDAEVFIREPEAFGPIT